MIAEWFSAGLSIWREAKDAARCSFVNAQAIRDGKGPQLCACGHHTMKQRVETWRRMGAPLAKEATP